MSARRRSAPSWVLAGVAACTMLVSLLVAAPAAQASYGSLLASVNAERESAGAAPLARRADLDSVAQAWSEKMARAGVLSHNPSYSTQVKGWKALAENVGYGGSEATVHRALMNSSGHRANILNKSYTQVGLGIASGNGSVWITQVFRQPTAAYAGTPAVKDYPLIHRSGTWYARRSLTSGPATEQFAYGNPSDVGVSGDWDGDGRETAGVFRPSRARWYLRGGSGAGPADAGQFTFGASGDIPLAGDWNGDGRQTPGLFRPSTATWYLTNSLTRGRVDAAFRYGSPGDVPVVGDWDGNGMTSIGIFRSGTWHLTNRLGGAAQMRAYFGGGGDRPVVGDWDANGSETLGVVRGGTWHVTNRLGGATQAHFSYGNSRDRALAKP